MVKQTTFCLLLSIFLLNITSNSIAQFNQNLEDYVIEIWSAEEGLPSNNLRHITKDQNGFLWISTFSGLVRFDGNEFKNFTTENAPILSTSVFYSVLPYEKGKMFISTQSSGLIHFDNGKFSTIPDAENLPKSIQTTYLDSNNRLWIGTRNSGVYFLENDKVIRFSIPSFNNQSIMSFVEDNKHNIWIASSGLGVARVKGDDVKIFTKEDGLNSNSINFLLFHNQQIYAGTEKGLCVYNFKKWNKDTRFGNAMINNIAVDKDNNLWFASDTGLARLKNTNEFEFITEEDGLPSRQISAMTFDNENNIWLTSKRGGLIQLKLSNFTNYTPLDGLSYKGINIIEEAPNGNIYVGSDNGDIDLIKNGIVSKITLNKNFKNVSIKDIYASAEGVLWIASYEGVIKKEGNNEQYFTTSNGLLSQKARKIFESASGDIWIGSRNGGLNKILQNGNVESIGVEEGLGSNFVFSIDQAPDGRIVVGTANGGLDIVHKNGEIEILKPDSTLTGFSIFNVYIENNNRFWLATNVGLYCYQNNEFTLINTSNGLQVETIFDIEEDEKGFLWATSIFGMVQINKSKAIELIDKKIDQISTTIFDNSDGMISQECTGATRMLKTSDGKIWIPTIKGIAILDPDNLLENTKMPSIFIEEINVDDKKIDANFCCNESADSPIIIEPGHRNYTISYTSLSMYSPKKVLFKYKLDGFDDEWINIGPERQAKYTNLPYGEYSFKVLASNNNGIWSTNYASVNFIIKPYFYETKWFIVLLILIFIVATFLIYTYQTKEVNKRNAQLVKLNSELDSFAYSVSHDIKAPLSSIQGLLNIAKMEKGENALFYYDKIESSVGKLDNFIKDIIDYSKNSRMDFKKEPINVNSIIKGVIDGLAYLSNDKEIKTTILIDKSLEIVSDKTRFAFIANNLLTNSFRYADLTKEEPYVKVTAKTKGSIFCLSIEDNGQGIKKEFHSKIFDMFYRANEFKSGSGLGLYIVKESLDKMGGTVKLESEFGVGTKITVEIPL